MIDFERIEKVKLLIQHYVPAGYHCRRAEETLDLIHVWCANCPPVTTCKCGKEKLCPSCEITEADFDIRVNYIG